MISNEPNSDPESTPPSAPRTLSLSDMLDAVAEFMCDETGAGGGDPQRQFTATFDAARPMLEAAPMMFTALNRFARLYAAEDYPVRRDHAEDIAFAARALDMVTGSNRIGESEASLWGHLHAHGFRRDDAWLNIDHFILDTDDGRIIRISGVDGCGLPAPGDWLVGYYASEADWIGGVFPEHTDVHGLIAAWSSETGGPDDGAAQVEALIGEAL